MKRFASILYWSVIPAAFIGPGTITTATKAGGAYGYALLWTLTFSVAACATLQIAAARLSAATGRDLGGAIAARFGGRLGRALAVGVAAAIVVGCAAYEAGNLLGASSGLASLFDGDRRVFAAATSIPCAALLWFGAPALLARVMGACVAVMGVAFTVVAFSAKPDAAALLKGAFVPTLPLGSGALALALVGTTVVPYNLFLGAGLARGRSTSDARFGTLVAVALGGLVSAAVVVVGATTIGDYRSIPELAEALRARFGDVGGALFCVGLFAAGFTSAITAPLAAGLAIEGALRGGGAAAAARKGGAVSARERAVRFLVLGVGVVCATSEVEPLPAIVAAQALNGFVLPLAAAFLLVAANDRDLPSDARNGRAANVLGSAVVFVATALGASQAGKAAAAVFGFAAPTPKASILAGLVAGAVVLVVALLAARGRRAK